MIMKSRAMLQLSISFVVLLFGLVAPAPIAGAEDSKDTQALLEALRKSKLTVLDGVRQAGKGGAVPISAKFELEDGKLSLSVYTAGKGLSVPPEQNVLQELSGSPEGEKWTPNVEVFKDVPHVARSSAQLTLMALGKASLTNIIGRAQKAQSGTVFSVTPMIRDRTAVYDIVIWGHVKVQKVFQPL